MSRTLDFNSFRQPTLRLLMPDEDQTIINVIAPTVDLVEQFRANLPELLEVLKNDSPECRKTLYGLAAKLISCNRDGLTVTAEDLAKKYEMGREDLAIFYAEYGTFIDELNKEKN